jgi:hypothetical protein
MRWNIAAPLAAKIRRTADRPEEHPPVGITDLFGHIG